jgi:hypothetical protein
MHGLSTAEAHCPVSYARVRMVVQADPREALGCEGYQRSFWESYLPSWENKTRGKCE